jgi:hypothetical protein
MFWLFSGKIISGRRGAFRSRRMAGKTVILLAKQLQIGVRLAKIL